MIICFQNQDQQDQQEAAPKPSSAEQSKCDLEADNKQLRELVTSLHQKQQTTSLEVCTIINTCKK